MLIAVVFATQLEIEFSVKPNLLLYYFMSPQKLCMFLI